jgi:hypothetical protein
MCCIEQALLLWHVLDIMHYERNICKNSLKTFMGDKDTPTSRMDSQDCDIRKNLWLHRVHGNNDRL